MALLAVGAIALAVGLVLLLLQLQTMQERLDEQDQRIQEQQDRIEEQDELIEQKETFGAAMQELLNTAARFETVDVGGLVPQGHLTYLAANAWRHRHDAAGLDRDIADVATATADLAKQLSDAQAAASANASGSAYETVLDELGSGFVTTSIDDADTLCGEDVAGCVVSADPRVVHIDAADDAMPYMSDWLRTGVAYHEFAHVLQVTNPEPTEVALSAFGGDLETMADCFALTYLDGWSLDHRVWVSANQYWDVTLGYGHVCDEPQRQAVRDWHAQLGYVSQPVSQ
ncbi:hypothetical protein [Microbacterium stercoris]|uniref:Neutral zinc metallopeptidase n=1 Tax=Microbacterium stercoris TaxID=2820289 RepID=A0A939TWF4_9MICO|nr:hypothetical protein [Microbacterium stercoris]MBO3662597.1 hypothetical protein [Microbacterium stercoris]